MRYEMQEGWYDYAFLPIFGVFLICWNELFRNSSGMISYTMRINMGFKITAIRKFKLKKVE